MDRMAVVAYGCPLHIFWNGHLWESPSCHTAHPRAVDAMYDEVERFIQDGGGDVETPEQVEEITSIVSTMRAVDDEEWESMDVVSDRDRW